MTEAATSETITYVIPCGAEKLNQPAPAREMYRGAMFRHTLASVEAMIADNHEDARILILSARYGLLELDTVIDPYEQRMDRPGAITAEELTNQALQLGIDWGAQVYAFLPRPYLARLDAALRALDVYVQDVYEATGGIGEQRHVNAVIATPAPHEETTVTATAEPAPEETIHAAYDAAPKDCNGRARLLDLRDLSGLPAHIFEATVIALHREHRLTASWSNKPTIPAEDNASLLIDGTSRHLLVWGHWTQHPAHNQAACQGHPWEYVTSNR